MSNIIEIRDVTDFNKFKRSHRRGIIFYGAKWCGACSQIMPLYSRISDRYHKRISFAHADVETCGLDFTRIPVFVSYYDGKETNNMVGSNVSSLKDFIREAILFGKKRQEKGKSSHVLEHGNNPNNMMTSDERRESTFETYSRKSTHMTI